MRGSHADIARCLSGAADHVLDGVAVVALDRLDRPVRENLLDDPDVLGPEQDQVARLGHDARTVGDRPAGLLGPVPDVADIPVTLALRAEWLAGLAGGPGDEVGAPG